MKKLSYFLLIFPVLVLAQSTDQNFVKTTLYKVPTTISITSPTVTEATIGVTYFDGLGRPIQKLAAGQSMSGKDIIVPIVYDALGRTPKDYLPVAAPDNSMSYMGDAISKLVIDYSAQYGADGNNPYTETVFGNSPLNRVMEQAAPGEDWAMGNGHTIKYEYGLNTEDDDVKLYTATAGWNGTYGVYDETPGNADGGTPYPVEKLYKTIMKNENWHSGHVNTTEEYKNTEGQVLLKRSFNAEEAPYDTYYVYDQFGNLSFVIPPAITGDTTGMLDELCYQYRYDNKNRLVEKKLPGKQWEFIVYDRLNRIAATGPSLSPFGTSDYGWLMTKYDRFNRTVLTAWATRTDYLIDRSARFDLQNDLNGTTYPLNEAKSLSNTTINGISFRYTTVAFPTAGYHVLSVNYYDDYNYTGAPTGFTTVEGQDVYYNNSTHLPKGFPTGSWVRAVETAIDYNGEMSYSLYDKKARVLRTRSSHYIHGGYSQTDNAYDYSGKATYTVNLHKRDSGSGVTEIYVKDLFSYYDNDKLKRHYQQIGVSGPVEQMADIDYDELGRLLSKSVGGGIQTVDYSYNIRGWLTGINDVNDIQDDLFAFKINYNKPDDNINGVTGLFNGNISETYWRTANDNVLRMYGYKYDDLNRFNEVIYKKPEVNLLETNSYNETVHYDRNGNITDLQRYGEYDDDVFALQIDDLTYAYDPHSPNRLLDVTDGTLDPNGFKDDSGEGHDYTYDGNGNLKSDKNKEIDLIIYNHLNLPLKIYFGELKKIEYLYNAAGQKVRKKVTSKTALLGGITTIHTTDYLNGFQYFDGTLEFFATSEGYVKNTEDGGHHFNYVYNYTDHLGNVRLSYGYDPVDEVVKILEENNYYAYGLKHQNYNMNKATYEKNEGHIGIRDLVTLTGAEYNYKYNGKEWQGEFGLDVTAMDYRQYDNAIGRFNGMDALAEMSFSLTPYQFAAGNPVYFSDPSGLRHWPTTNSANADLNAMPEWAATMWNATADGTNSYWTAATDGSFDNDDGSGYIDTDGMYIETPIYSLQQINVVPSTFSDWLSCVQAQIDSINTFYGNDLKKDKVHLTEIGMGLFEYVEVGELKFLQSAVKLVEGVKLVDKAYVVYQGVDAAGVVKYVGITSRNPLARFAEHLSSLGGKASLEYRVIDGATNLTKEQARVLEQTLINQYRLEKNVGQLINKINSIAPQKWGAYGL